MDGIKMPDGHGPSDEEGLCMLPNRISLIKIVHMVLLCSLFNYIPSFVCVWFDFKCTVCHFRHAPTGAHQVGNPQANSL